MRSVFRRDSRGFTLLELLVVTVILAIMTAGIMPIVAERIRTTRARTTVSQLVLDVRAARWNAVSAHADLEMVVEATPDNFYEYVDSRGRTRHVRMPHGIRIVSATNPICFKANGSVPGGAMIVLELELEDDLVSRWEVATNVLGVPSVTHEKVEL